jgi:hypothetical protein
MSASASILRLIGNTPVPLFGSLTTALAWSTPKLKALPRFAGWTLPLGVGALWFIWPAVDDGWKVSVGILPDPQHAAAAKQPIGSSTSKGGQVMDVPADIVAKVTAIHHDENDDGEDMGPDLVAMAASSGDYSALQAKWETFIVKSTNPGEDDDDDEDEDEEEEEEEAEDDEGEDENEDDE